MRRRVYQSPRPVGPRLPLVLIIDDHADTLAMMGEYLSASGFEVCGTSTSMHAIELAVKVRPDIILTDVSMPFVDGWTLATTFREHPLTKDTPVVMITGHADAVRNRGRAEHSAFLTKPCAPAKVVETLRELLGAGTIAQPSASTSHAPALSPEL